MIPAIPAVSPHNGWAQIQASPWQGNPGSVKAREGYIARWIRHMHILYVYKYIKIICMYIYIYIFRTWNMPVFVVLCNFNLFEMGEVRVGQ